VDYRFGVDFGDALENAPPEFVPGRNPDVPQEGAHHLAKVVSIILNHDPCVRVRTYLKRSGRLAKNAWVSCERCAE
jgi:hypothetical protein